MPTDIVMPQMGESIFEGTITKWLKKTGDSVQKDEPLFEISTDKVDAEIPSPVAGVLTEIKFAEGATVAINTVVAIVGEVGSALVTPAVVAPVVAASSVAPSSEAVERTSESASARANVKPAASSVSAVSVPSVPPVSPVPSPSAESTGSVEIVMPQMGESIFEGTITKWLKKVGDSVHKDEPIFEISTDKVDADIPAPVAGILTEIKVPEGATVGINTVVAVIGGAAASSSGKSEEAVAAQTSGPAPVAASPASASAASAAATIAAPAGAAIGQQMVPAQESVQQDSIQQDKIQGAKLRSSPLVRRIAKDNHLDLSKINGTGAGGRITKDDVLRTMNEGGHADRDTCKITGDVKDATPAIAPLVDVLVPLTKMRAIIAQRMVESMAISPHVHSVYKVDMTRIVHLRAQHKATYEQKHGVRLTYMPFIAVAAVQALRTFPVVNASLEGNSIHYHQNIHLGIAVALEWGLIVPVIRGAEQQNFMGLARAIADLADRARSRKLKPDEISGSTFTLTNSGIFGDEFGTPIINQPEAAILAIGALKKEPVVVTDAEGNDSIAIRNMQHFCLGFDHRIIDGADAGKFMTEFKKALENWESAIT